MQQQAARRESSKQSLIATNSTTATWQAVNHTNVSNFKIITHSATDT